MGTKGWEIIIIGVDIVKERLEPIQITYLRLFVHDA